MKLVSVVVMLILAVMLAKTLSGSASSGLDIAPGGIAGLCSDQAAVSEASGQDSLAPVTLASPGPGGLAALKMAGASLNCSTPTTTP